LFFVYNLSKFEQEIKSKIGRSDTMGTQEYFAKGLAKGLAEGERKKAIESARKMLSKGFKIEDIRDITGLSIEEIEKL